MSAPAKAVTLRVLPGTFLLKKKAAPKQFMITKNTKVEGLLVNIAWGFNLADMDSAVFSVCDDTIVGLEDIVSECQELINNNAQPFFEAREEGGMLFAEATVSLF
jgi:hypothetical protein